MAGMTDDDLFNGAPVPATAPPAPAPVAQSMLPPASSPASSPAGPAFDVPSAITSAAQKYGVDPRLALAIGQQESGLNAYPHDSSAGAVGPMQLMGPTASNLGVSNIRDPAQNVDGGVKYLKQLQDQFGADHPELIAAAYNAGPQNAAKYGTNWSAYPVPSETTPYVGAVTARLGQPAPGTSATMPSGLTPEQQQIWEDLQVKPASTPSGQTPDTTGAFTVGPNQTPPTAAQAAWYKANTPAGGWSNVPGPGEHQLPYALQAGGPIPQTPGAEYVDLDGVHHVVPGGPVEAAAGAVSGLAQGVGSDLKASLDKLTGGQASVANPNVYGSDNDALTNPGPSSPAQGQAVLAGDAAQQRDYAIRQGGNQFAQAGRFVGQALPATAAAGLVPEIEAPSALGGIGRVAATGLTNALRGTAAAATNVGPNSASVPQQLATGALAGVVSPLVVEAPGAALKAVTGVGRTVAPDVATLADTAQTKYGIPLASAQVAAANGDRKAAYAYSNMLASDPKLQAQNQVARQNWMKGVTGTYGDPSGDISPPSLSANQQRVGDNIGAVADRIGTINASTTPDRLSGIVANASQDPGFDGTTNLQNLVDTIKKGIGSDGTMPASAYNQATDYDSPLMTAIRAGKSPYPGQIKDALDDALEGSAPPEDVADLRNSRWQYKNLMTVAQAAQNQNNIGPDGVLTPAALNTATTSNFKNRAFQGAGDLDELNAIRKQFMTEPPQSGTTPRSQDLLQTGIAGLATGGATDMALSLLHQPETTIPTVASALAGTGAKLVADAIKRNAVGGSAANIIARSLPNAPRSALSGISGVVKPVTVPLSALAGLHGLSVLPNQSPVGANAQ